MINVGLIGYGYWGPNLSRNLAETEGLTLSAIADARPDRREAAARRHPGVLVCGDGASLLNAECAVGRDYLPRSRRVHCFLTTQSSTTFGTVTFPRLRTHARRGSPTKVSYLLYSGEPPL